VLGGRSLTFGAWGEPVRRALAIAALSSGGQVLVDATTHAELGDPVEMTQMHGLVDLDGQPMTLYSLVISSASSAD